MCAAHSALLVLMISRANLFLAVNIVEAPLQRHSNQWESFCSVFEIPPAMIRATRKRQMVHLYHFITYFLITLY